MSGWELAYYATASGRCPVADYIDDLDPRDAAAVAYDLDLLEEFGVALGAPKTRHLQGKLWELRSRGRVEHRTLYVAVRGQQLLLSHAFTKKNPADSAEGDRHRAGAAT